MHPDPTFTDPPAAVQQARIALARAQRRLALDEHALDPCCDLTGIGLAFLSLEALHPAYPPLAEIDISADVQADIAEAIRLLALAITEADSAAEVARYAATIADLSDLDRFADDQFTDEMLTDDPGLDTGGCSASWP